MNNVKKFLFTIVLAILLVTLSTYVFATDNNGNNNRTATNTTNNTVFLILHKQLVETQKLQFLN